MCFMFFRIEHAQLHEKHKGHEDMHAEMVLILLLVIIVSQIVLVQWKKWHFKSYQVNVFCYKSSLNLNSGKKMQAATLLGMWIIPVIICFRRQWFRFLVIWSLFSMATCMVTLKATRRQISGRTPRYTYVLTM